MNPCQRCETATAISSWSGLGQGASCPDDGDPCTADVCDVHDLCVHTVVPDGAACGTGMICTVGKCAWTNHTATMMAGDGTRFATKLYFPPGVAERRSVLLVRTAYPDDLTSPTNPYGLGYLLHRGYIVAVQHIRGRGGSAGQFYPFSHEYLDGGEAVDWVLAQPWCNGRVATIGASYDAFTALAAAAANPRVAMTLADGAPLSGFDGWPNRRGGLGLGGGLGWYANAFEGAATQSTYIGLVTNHSPAYTLPEAMLGHALSWHKERVDAFGQPHHPFWSSQGLRTKLPGYCVPTIHVQAHREYADDPSEIFEIAQRDGCEGARPLQRLVYSRWGHGATVLDATGAYSSPAVRRNPAHEMIDRYLARYLDGRAESFADLPRVAYFDASADSWRTFSAWPPATSPVSLFLSPSGQSNAGALTNAPATVGADSFLHLRPSNK